ncbi:MAG: HTH-type transcriptional repressor CarH [Anaerolineae bacterium]
MTFSNPGLAPNQPSTEPLYNIGVVSRMTGIPVATLRIWERRYSFPESARTAGGHRLYSEQEILRLQWVKARIDEGMQTGRAIKALKHFEETEGVVPETPFAVTAPSGETAPAATPPPQAAATEQVPQATLEAITARLTAALLEHDLDRANQVLMEALAVQPLESLLIHVIPATLVRLGEAWHEGKINVATEHLATNFLRNRLLMWMQASPAPVNVPPVVLACAPDEWHESTLLIFAALLRRRRWPVAYLGQSVPMSDLNRFVQDLRPGFVVLVAMTPQSAERLAAWPAGLPDIAHSDEITVCYAGAPFTHNEALQNQVPGVYLGDTIEQGVETLDRMLRQRYRIS